MTVKYYFDAPRGNLQTFDNAMDNVNAIMLASISKTNIESYSITDDNKIYKVQSISQVGETLDGNSRQIVVTSEFEMGINQAIC